MHWRVPLLTIGVLPGLLWAGTAAADTAKDEKASLVAVSGQSEAARRQFYAGHYVRVSQETIGGYAVASTPNMPTGGYVLPTEITAYILGPSPLRSDEAAGLAKAHNKRLLLKLGLPPDTAPPPVSGLSLRRSGFPMREFASLTLAHEF